MAKYVKSSTYNCYVRCATFILSVERMSWPKTGDIYIMSKRMPWPKTSDIYFVSRRMPWPKTGGTHYSKLLGFADKGHTIKEFVV